MKDGTSKSVRVKEKNIMVSILLVVFFGPFGMFYATIFGGILMTLVAVAGVLIFFQFLVPMIPDHSDGILQLIRFCIPVYYLMCAVWASQAAYNYNDEFIWPKSPKRNMVD